MLSVRCGSIVAISPVSPWYCNGGVDAVDILKRQSSPSLFPQPLCLHFRRTTRPTLPWSGTLGCFFHQFRQDISHTGEMG